eukprot:172062-Rhodomonas_salina.2
MSNSGAMDVESLPLSLFLNREHNRLAALSEISFDFIINSQKGGELQSESIVCSSRVTASKKMRRDSVVRECRHTTVTLFACSPFRDLKYSTSTMSPRQRGSCPEQATFERWKKTSLSAP